MDYEDSDDGDRVEVTVAGITWLVGLATAEYIESICENEA